MAAAESAVLAMVDRAVDDERDLALAAGGEIVA
jgi:hypothetical protein